MGSSPASHPASWPGSMDTCCISPWSITVGSRDSPPTQRLRLLFLSSCWSPHLVPWPQKWRQELTPGNVLPLLLQVLWHVVPKLFSSGILVWGCVLLLPRPPWGYKCCKTASNHPPSGSAASAAPAPKQTLTGSSQSAVCPLHREHEKERKPWELCTGAPSMCPGQPKSWTAPPVFGLSWKTTEWPNSRRAVCPQRSLVGSAAMGMIDLSSWHPCPSLGTTAGDLLQTGYQAANAMGGSIPWQERNWLPILLSTRKDFFAVIHTFQQPASRRLWGKWGQWHQRLQINHYYRAFYLVEASEQKTDTNNI